MACESLDANYGERVAELHDGCFRVERARYLPAMLAILSWVIPIAIIATLVFFAVRLGMFGGKGR